MPGPGDEIAPGAGGHGHLRASRADRERVIGALKAAFVQGRLAKDEFDLRVSQTFASRTYAELAALTADLPAGLTAAKPSPPARAPGGRAVVRPGRVATAAAALYAGAWTYLLFLAPHPGENPWTRPLILDGTVVCLGIVIFCVAAIFLRRREGRTAANRSTPGSRSAANSSKVITPPPLGFRSLHAMARRSAVTWEGTSRSGGLLRGRGLTRASPDSRGCSAAAGGYGTSRRTLSVSSVRTAQVSSVSSLCSCGPRKSFTLSAISSRLQRTRYMCRAAVPAQRPVSSA